MREVPGSNPGRPIISRYIMNAYDIILEVFDELGYKEVEMIETKRPSKYSPQPISVWTIPLGNKIFVDPGEYAKDGIAMRDGNGSECTIYCYGTEVDISDLHFAPLNITLDLINPDSIKDLKSRLA